MSKQCKCEHWQQCPICMPNRFDSNGNLLPPEPTPLQAARIRIEELERERDALLADNARLRRILECNIANLETGMSRSIQKLQANTNREELAATPEQSLAGLRNQVLEEAAKLSETHDSYILASEIRATKEPE